MIIAMLIIVIILINVLFKIIITCLLHIYLYIKQIHIKYVLYIYFTLLILLFHILQTISVEENNTTKHYIK